eukprot:6208926-Pleurochrysis_carterae.AAC.4
MRLLVERCKNAPGFAIFRSEKRNGTSRRDLFCHHISSLGVLPPLPHFVTFIRKAGAPDELVPAVRIYLPPFLRVGVCVRGARRAERDRDSCVPSRCASGGATQGTRHRPLLLCAHTNTHARAHAQARTPTYTHARAHTRTH